MYSQSDPRSALAPASKALSTPRGFGRATYARFYGSEPQQTGVGLRSWLVRGENFLTRFCQTEAGAILERANQPDEYAVLLPETGAEIEIEWNGNRVSMPGFSVAFVPAGKSRIAVKSGGPVVQVFTNRALDLLALCSNQSDYEPDPNVAQIVDWPEPKGGEKVRIYSLDVPKTEGRFGRIFRGRTIMINYLDPRDGPRDKRQLSPHDHADFQQGSLALTGEFVHHLRWPWTVDGTLWRDDEHVKIGTPSMAYIPAQVLHTSQAIGPGRNQLVDIFCPPRVDFSKKPGWVLNEEDYPAPEGI